ncbi:ATP-binding cassette domain-containing protein [Apilactobacillus micheneri]|uniref:ATP-binding cassette domain-containing protein n=1 Tax=Apilactobacillus micheneri TaxID=1899430 RepID=UPI001128B776|nr:ATP-binding cassette domain-containing protein [Apilactobacillus micheneri]TPR43375.1 ATP-binding cassette domain-containing protein [Apilactobacillus micheneri]TPR47469.1 ATP-binding cassette domain-containing protein [Apilactobacillus micheneri]
MEENKQPLLSVNNLNVAVQDRTLINNLSFQILPATLTCVTGENGVGKTTMVKAILKNFNKNNTVKATIKRSQFQYVPQFRNIDNDYPLTVKDFISLGLQHSMLPWLSRKEKALVSKVIKMTNLETLAKTPLGNCSGGEQQRVFLAQALVSDPKLLILDESTASLDKEAKFLLLDVVKQVIKKTHTAVIFITHDPVLVQTYGDYDLNIDNHQGTISKIKGVK